MILNNIKKIKLEGLTEQQINNLKRMANHCNHNEQSFRQNISINLVGRIQNKALATCWSNKSSVAEYEAEAVKGILIWFPYMTEDRAKEEAQNIRTKNSMNINVIVRDMQQLQRQFN